MTSVALEAAGQRAPRHILSGVRQGRVQTDEQAQGRVAHPNIAETVESILPEVAASHSTKTRGSHRALLHPHMDVPTSARQWLQKNKHSKWGTSVRKSELVRSQTEKSVEPRSLDAQLKACLRTTRKKALSRKDEQSNGLTSRIFRRQCGRLYLQILKPSGRNGLVIIRTKFQNCPAELNKHKSRFPWQLKLTQADHLTS
jgi:hypothetical protein